MRVLLSAVSDQPFSQALLTAFSTQVGTAEWNWNLSVIGGAFVGCG